MKFYEWVRLGLDSVFPVLIRQSRLNLKELVKQSKSSSFSLLDVGGRQSPYTIGLPVSVTVIDKPRESEMQKALQLGLNQELVQRLKKRRSNIQKVIFEDMVQTTLPDKSFDGVVSVEVIEHVQEDQEFLKQIERVLKPKGFVFITTPNGDYIPKANPDHVRHYTREQLRVLLQKYFEKVEVFYAVKTGKHRGAGIHSFDIRRPVRLFQTLTGNWINQLESVNVKEQSQKTAHLFAIAYKREFA